MLKPCEKPIEIKFKFFDEKYKAQFWKSEYMNGNLYIGILTYDEELEFWDNWGDLTVNLPGMCLEENEAFIDINNCASEIISILEKKGYIKNTDITRQSGFVTYPLYELTEEFLNGMWESVEEDEEK